MAKADWFCNENTKTKGSRKKKQPNHRPVVGIHSSTLRLATIRHSLAPRVNLHLNVHKRAIRRVGSEPNRLLLHHMDEVELKEHVGLKRLAAPPVLALLENVIREDVFTNTL